MHVALPPDLEQLVTAPVQSGRYSSVSEVIREALLLLEEREQRSEVRRQELCHIYRPDTSSRNRAHCAQRMRSPTPPVALTPCPLRTEHAMQGTKSNVTPTPISPSPAIPERE